MKNWHLKPDTPPAWPIGDDDEKIAPVFLEHIPGSPVDIEMEVGFLAAYGIPAVCTYPNDGEFSRVIMGSAACGADVFVPETLLEDARNILSGAAFSEDEEM